MIIFKEKLQTFQDKSFDVCREILSAGKQPAQKMEVDISRLKYVKT
jgi:hypothetical protein